MFSFNPVVLPAGRQGSQHDLCKDNTVCVKASTTGVGEVLIIIEKSDRGRTSVTFGLAILLFNAVAEIVV